MLKRAIRVFRVLLILGLAGMLFALPVLAAYSATIQVIETSNTSYTELPIIADVDNTYLAANGYITATGLDTRVEAGGVSQPHLVADDKTLFSIGVSANTTANLQYTTGNVALADMPVIVGYDGYVTITDAAALEPGSSFEIEIDGYIDTIGVSDNLTRKDDAIRVYVSAAGEITASVIRTIELRVTDTDDDCRAYWDGGAWQFERAAGNYIQVGYTNATELQSGGGMRFQDVPIPQGATIENAYLMLRAGNTRNNDDVNSVISGEDEDTTVAFTDYADYSARSHTAATVNWNVIPHWNVATWYNSPDIKTIIQEIVDRGGWASGNDMVIFWDDHAGNSTAVNGTIRDPLTFTGAGGSTLSPRLYITWGGGSVDVVAAGVTSGEHVVTVKTELKTVTFYPDAGVNSVDGHAYHRIAAGTLLWNDLTTGVGTDAHDVGTYFHPFRWTNHADANEYEALYRGITLFDTSALPDDAVVDSATLSIYGAAKTDSNADAPNLNVYSSAPVADNAIVAGDYDSLGSTAFSDNITYAAYDTAGYNDFVLNADGRGAIDVAGISKFGFRCANYDVDNIAPNWAAGTTTYFNAYTIEEGVDFAPKLEVSYYELVIYIDAVEQDREVLGMGVPDTSSDWVIMSDNCIPYMDYYKHTVGGTLIAHYQPITIISGTTLPDREGAAQNGTITWGTNPAGVSVTMGSLVSEDQPAPTIVGEVEPPADIAPTITQPANYFTARDMSSNPFYAIVKPLADLSGFNESWIWIFSATIIVFTGMVTALAYLKNLLIAGIAGFALIALFYAMGIYPFWILVIYSLMAVAIVIFERVQAL